MKARLMWVLPDGQRVKHKDVEIGEYTSAMEISVTPRGQREPAYLMARNIVQRRAVFFSVGFDPFEERDSGDRVVLFECDVLTLNP